MLPDDVRQALINTLISRGGYNTQDAINAANNSGGRASDLAREFLNYNPSGGGNGGNVNQSIQDAFNKLNQEVIKRFGQYRQGQPFDIDKVLAEKTASAKEQIDPFYNETLQNYITGVERKISRGTQDTKDLLAELQADTTSYQRDTQFSLDQALNKAREGYAGAGLFDSGNRLRTEGIAEAQTGNNLSDFLRKQQYRTGQINLGLSRQLEDIGSERQQTVRNIERQRTTDVEARKAQLAKEEGQRYVSGFQATLPPELKAQSGFDLLKDIGIFS